MSTGNINDSLLEAIRFSVKRTLELSNDNLSEEEIVGKIKEEFFKVLDTRLPAYSIQKPISSIPSANTTVRRTSAAPTRYGMQPRAKLQCVIPDLSSIDFSNIFVSKDNPTSTSNVHRETVIEKQPIREDKVRNQTTRKEPVTKGKTNYQPTKGKTSNGYQSTKGKPSNKGKITLNNLNDIDSNEENSSSGDDNEVLLQKGRANVQNNQSKGCQYVFSRANKANKKGSLCGAKTNDVFCKSHINTVFAKNYAPSSSNNKQKKNNGFVSTTLSQNRIMLGDSDSISSSDSDLDSGRGLIPKSVKISLGHKAPQFIKQNDEIPLNQRFVSVDPKKNKLTKIKPNSSSDEEETSNHKKKSQVSVSTSLYSITSVQDSLNIEGHFSDLTPAIDTEDDLKTDF